MCDQRRRLTYAQLMLESGRLAAFLRGAGACDGAAVAAQRGNRVELAVAHLACSAAGATFVPLSDAWRRTEMTHILSVSRAVVAPSSRRPPTTTTWESWRLRRDGLPELALAASMEGSGEFDVPSILSGRGPEPLPPLAEDPNLPRYVMVSSGSTSLPKLSLWSDNNLWAFSQAVARAVALSFTDRVLGLAPAGTGAIGYVYGVLFPILQGATSILLESWSPQAALDLMRAEQPTVLAAVPTQLTSS